jgi:hypothetical protein
MASAASWLNAFRISREDPKGDHAIPETVPRGLKPEQQVSFLARRRWLTKQFPEGKATIPPLA